MEARAVGRYLRVTPRKARYVLDTVRGKSTREALATLEFLPNEAARYIRKIIESAIGNAENNYAMDREALRIIRAYVDQGPTMKRVHPRARGRAFRILKRTSHITVVLTEDETLKKIVEKPKGRRATRRAKETAEAAPPKAKAAAGRKKVKPTEGKPKTEAVSAEAPPAAEEAAPSPAEEKEG